VVAFLIGSLHGCCVICQACFDWFWRGSHISQGE
jgi:hypothetical protein